MNQPHASRSILQQTLNRAEELHRQNDLTGAIQNYRAALQIAPDHPQALHGLGAALLQQRDFAKAMGYLIQAHNITPDDPHLAHTLRVAHNNWGNALQAEGDALAAIDHYVQALTLAPDSVQTLYNLGTALQTLGRHGDAKTYFCQALALSPDFTEAWSNRGVAAHELGHFDEAIDCFQRALTLNANCLNTHLNLGLAYAAHRDMDLARACARQALALAETTPSYSPYDLGLLLAKCGLIDEGVAQLGKALEREPDDPHGAQIILASLGRADAPMRASDAQLQRLYATRSQSWDWGAEGDAPYRGHLEVARLAQELAPLHNILDAGCGTGLVGALLADTNRRIDGVDLSPDMLQQAQTKGCYLTLTCCDLVAFMNQHPDEYDTITAAATFIHFHDLRTPFQAAWTALKSNGWVVFTVFPTDASAGLDGHAEGGCYQHSPSDIDTAANHSGFAVHTVLEIIHEYQFGQPVTALLIALHKK